MRRFFQKYVIMAGFAFSVISANAAAIGSVESVYHVDPTWDGSIIALSTLATFAPYINSDHWIRYRCPCDPGEVHGLDHGVIGNANGTLDALSDVTAFAAVVAPPVADFLDVGWSRAFVEDFSVYAEVLSINGALVSITKYTVQRPLPRTYAGDSNLIHSAGGYRSFYSGHTSTTVAALAAASITMNLRHSAGLWPWLLTAGIGTSVALERVAAGRHFYSDVAVGAIAGGLVGTLVPWLHERRNLNALSAFSLRPTDRGALLAWTRSF